MRHEIQAKRRDCTARNEEQVEKQIEAVYRVISLPRPDEMASLATRSTASYKSDSGLLGRYGDIDSAHVRSLDEDSSQGSRQLGFAFEPPSSLTTLDQAPECDGSA
jgi:hypothetical protein